MARFLKLDRMEILGFKSFYGRTQFEFPGGITAVVGPNGCGKSNIGDAISWVLGEQKASSLRSDRMEDVIFNGTEGRKPLGMAEVSLHFKNAASGLAVSGDEDVSGGNGNGRPGEGHSGNGRGGNGPGTAEALDGLLEGMDHPVVPVASGAVGAAVGAAQDEDRPLTTAPESGPPADETAETAAKAMTGESGTSAGPEGGTRFFLEDLPEEVVVTRRLYRSGESEYALNGRRCRLRDVQDLLTRTEIGSRLYTTIEQGRIDQILSAKPKDRRSIIEEAAGILGYKNKRRQAELKLEATQANLLRLSDIAGEVEKQISALRRQAGRARRYRRLLERMRELKAVIAHCRLLALDEEGRTTGEVINVARDREAEAASTLARVEAEVESLRQALEEGEEAARRRRDDIHALDLEIDRLQGRLRSGEEQKTDLAARISETGMEIDRLEERVREQVARRGGLSSRLLEVRALVEKAALSVGDSEARRQARGDAIGARETELEQIRGTLLQHLEELAEAQRDGAALEEQIRSGRATLARFEREAAEAHAMHARLADEVAELDGKMEGASRRFEERRHERDGARCCEEEAIERLAACERQAEERRGRAAALSERQEALQELERQHAGCAEGVADVLRGAAGFEARGVVGEEIEVPPGLDRATAAVLDTLCEAVLVTDMEEAASGVTYLRGNSAGRVAFVREAPGLPPPPLPQDLPGRPGVLGTLRGRIGGLASVGPVEEALSRSVLVENLRVAIELQAAFPGWSFVTAEGDIARADGVLIGGDGSQVHHGLLARRAEMVENARQIDDLGDALRAAEAEVEVLRRDLADRRARSAEAEKSLREEEREMLRIDLLLRERRVELVRREQATPLLREEQARTEQDLTRNVAEFEELTSARDAAGTRRRELEASVRSVSDDLAEQRRDLDRIQGEVAEAGAALAAGQQRLAALERENEAAEEGVGEIQALIKGRTRERSEWAGKAAEIESQGTVMQQELGQTLASRAESARGEEAALAGLAYDRSLLHSREQAAREGRAEHDARREELQQHELRKARLSSDLEHLATTCREDLSMTFEALRASPPAIEAGRTLEEYEEELAGRRERLEGIGPVNLMAIEQCSELEERFGFLDAQRKDLEGSVASLRDTIRRINRESRQRFLAAFEAIQADFQTCFVVLFGGGRAELRLQDGEEDDVLEAGVEMVAQPPGKKLQSINLLSGGERALTAVALLFSLFRYRPSPFCVLDEVDAPLDEANVERFIRLLQQLAQETQFILITHNRTSMEAANLLYGVTMEEPGVSKVLPLRFE